MSRAERSLGQELAQALHEEGLGWRRSGPLLAGAALFGVAGLWLHGHAAWALSLGLWLGHAATDGLAGLIARRLDAAQQAALPGLLLLQGLRRQHALRRVEQERARLRAELQMLQAQIEPHFLFNTLATLRSFVRQGSDRALPLLDAITGFLDTALARTRQTESTLGEECQLVEHYLAIMALRLGERLRWRVDVDEALRGLPLPPLMLQPLVENAVQHSIEPSEAGGELLLQAERAGDRLRLRVTNTGRALSDLAAPGHGLALANLRQRLQALHGDRADFALQSLADGSTEALISLPCPPP